MLALDLEEWHRSSLLDLGKKANKKNLINEQMILLMSMVLVWAFQRSHAVCVMFMGPTGCDHNQKRELCMLQWNAFVLITA